MTIDDKVQTAFLLDQEMSRRDVLKKGGKYAATSWALKFCSKLTLRTGVFAAGITCGIVGAFWDITRILQRETENLPLLKDNGLAMLISYNTYDQELVYNKRTNKLYFGRRPWTIKIPEGGIIYLPNEDKDEIDFGLTDADLAEVGRLFIPMYKARVEIAMQQKVNPNYCIEGATKNDLYMVLQDPKIQSLLVFGHGYWGAWQATDGSVSSIDLEKNSWEMKKGYLLRHCCGDQKYDPEKVFRLNEADKEGLGNYLNWLSQKHQFSLEEKSLCFSWIREGYYSDITFNLLASATSLGCAQCGDVSLPASLRLLSGLETRTEKKEEFLSHFKKGSLRDSVEREIMEQNNEKNVYVDGFGKKIVNYFKDLRKIVEPFIVETDWQFGTQVFRRENIFGWDRTVYPWDYFWHPFAGRKPAVPPPYK